MNRRFQMAIVTASSVLVAFLLVGAVLGQAPDTSSSDPYRHIGVYTEVFSKIKSDYVEDPDMKNVSLGAINGLLVSLDPFASYLNADQYKQYLKAKESPKAGVGLVLSRKYGYEISIVDAIPGSPADKLGLATGDIIESINGIATRDMPLAYTDVLFNGDSGSSVDLMVLRLRKAEPSKMTIPRAKIDYPALTVKMLEDKVGYLAAQSLEPGKVKAIAAAVADLEKQGMQKLVLDLRHSVAGPPEEGVDLARLFLEKGQITYVMGQKYPKQSFDAEPSKVVWKGPMVLLTNRGTASGAEVAAGALLDHKRAAIVGERTYGDAAIRKAIPTQDGGAVLLAVAKFYTPAGKAIPDTSITPSLSVLDSESAPEVDDDNNPATPTVAKPGEDAILKKGIEVLKNGLPAQAAKVDERKMPVDPKSTMPVVPNTPPAKQ
jgi:carboxyl-terminal processing protease